MHDGLLRDPGVLKCADKELHRWDRERSCVSTEPVHFDIGLNQEAGVRTDTVTVTSGPFDTQSLNAPSEKTLSKAEIQALSPVIVSDPLRAAQALPGVAASSDVRAEFAIRGAG